jgi:LacI family transcriptional regulator
VTKYLLDMGHRDIAHITAPVAYAKTVNDIQKRYEGHQQALRDVGLEPDPRLVVEGNLQQQSGVLAVEMLLSRGRPFSAIFSANDQMIFGARLALFRRGIRVPEDVSLVGFDDESSAAYMVPPLTTARQPSVQMGQVAAQAILNMINGGSPDLPIFEADLIIRESVSRHR